ncbi:hypothetical protein CKO28_01210 [Rhodovibrio sodomensis]|uniref:Glycerophosphoryl diester phosphodiesterase membrane domain-containing protein n=1 Tax=Rhodovibrio sodomensis TaxID=1088 RepID=A0ABS1D957_9PROT|nr:hypothetical protein [Rhodovibrio sodomensis]MBK1666662.1 hypothetical protein [Rhodovibrio sodomensis]
MFAPQLPSFSQVFTQTAQASWNFVREHPWQIAASILPSVAAAAWFGVTLADQTESGPAVVTPGSSISTVVALATLLFAVLTSATTVHIGALRWMRAGESMRVFINLFDRVALVWVWRSIKLQALLLLPFTGSMLLGALIGLALGAPLEGVGLSAIPGTLAMIYIAVRLAPWAATFVDPTPTSLSEALSLTRGRFFAILGRMFVPFILSIAASMLAALVSAGLSGFPLPPIAEHTIRGLSEYASLLVPWIAGPLAACLVWGALEAPREPDGDT